MTYGDDELVAGLAKHYPFSHIEIMHVYIASNSSIDTTEMIIIHSLENNISLDAALMLMVKGIIE